MGWGLTRTTLERPGWIPIDEDEASSIISAMQQLLEAVGLEERYGLLLDAYREYEVVLMRLALESMIGLDVRWPQTRSSISPVAQALGNFFTAQRHYSDRVCDVVGKVSTSSGMKQVAKRKLERHEKQNPQMHVVAMLRNHVQHYEHIVHALHWPADVHREGKRQGVEHRVLPILIVDNLDRNRDFDDAAKKTLREMGSRIVITHLVRGYVSAIGDWHQWVRGELRPDIDSSAQLIAATLSRAQREFDDSRSYVQVVLETPDGEVEEEHGVFYGPAEFLHQAARSQPASRGVNLGYVSTYCDEIQGS